MNNRNERNDEKTAEEQTEQPEEPWHQRHLPVLLAGGLLLLLVFAIVSRWLFPS